MHILARAVVLSEGKVLVAQAEGASNTFLPGGHVESGESIPAALARELEEEMGVQAAVECYLGAVEHMWKENKQNNYEINHCFNVHCADLHPGKAVTSKEKHLSFKWLKVTELKTQNLLPAPLQHLIFSLEEGVQDVWWASTL